MSTKYELRIELISDALIGAGEGYGTIIDTDSLFDDFGFPYIPAKRIKGILLESAQIVKAMLSNFNYKIPDIIDIFGEPEKKEGNLKVNNFYLVENDKIVAWLKYLQKKYAVLQRQSIINTLSSVRFSTAIDEKTDIAKKHSLRKERVINKGLIFSGSLEFEKKYEDFITLVCANVDKIGTKRNRGLGDIKCVLLKDGKPIIDNVLRHLKKEVDNEIN